MQILLLLFLGLMALQHLLFLWLEMFAWTSYAPKIFRGFPKEFFQKTKALAANQGLYNGFLAAGLIWAMLAPDPVLAKQLSVFFTACVAAAGIYGGFSVQRSIFFIQALPALLALVLLMFAA